MGLGRAKVRVRIRVRVRTRVRVRARVSGLLPRVAQVLPERSRHPAVGERHLVRVKLGPWLR